MKTQVYNVGPDELNENDFKESGIPANAKWIVYYYESSPYEGEGELVYKVGRSFFRTSLGHCSCYGPMDNGCGYEEIKIKDYQNNDNIHNTRFRNDVHNKVMELII